MATDDGVNVQKYSLLIRCCTFGVIFLIIATAATLIPLFATGTIALGSPAASSQLRLTYDPVYYGNLHPYLYPSEREKYQVTTDYDVIIVGAGIAGLSAAWVLRQQSNLSVLVLEARVGTATASRSLRLPYCRISFTTELLWLVKYVTYSS